MEATFPSSCRMVFDMGSLVFDSAAHRYYMDGIERPSVTQITRFLSYDHKSAQPWLAEIAAERGTAVHEACMLIDYGEEPEETPEIFGFLTAYRRFLADYSPSWDGIERPLASLELGYAGTVDRYGRIDGKRCIVDLKTGQKHIPALAAQLNGYRILLDGYRFFADRLYGLYLRRDGTYELCECDTTNDTFMACMTLHKATEAAKRRSKRSE